MQKILIIQTAFIGDVVLATALIENLAAAYPGAQIDFLLRKGNESLLQNNPHLQQVWIWDKKGHKYRDLFRILKSIRQERYDKVINVQRFFTTGLITVLAGARTTAGFDKNPLSIFFSRRIRHILSTTPPFRHEIERNNELIRWFTDTAVLKPRLYPSPSDQHRIAAYTVTPFITMSPSSVWFTKKYPNDKWIDLINRIPATYKIFLLGGKDNTEECQQLAEAAGNKNVEVLAGQLSFLQSAALMQQADMNYVNDSGPLHFCSAVNAPVTAVFCSTVKNFGFTPLSDRSFVVETTETLACRPCGLHGHKTCPQQHFKCAVTIQTEQLLKTLAQ
ncbi:MAG: glycosyltransferase family 9 protein [Ferruginibacter sp.]